jgi:2,5-diketo-D-gluconate reductase A
MPLLGFGTWQLTGDEASQATAWALEAGYRHLDTATMYRNEREVGAALTASGLPRPEVFVTTKLSPDRAGARGRTLHQSLELLGTDYVDLWLIHWPPDKGAGVDLWTAFGQAREDGLARNIGVSNYSLGQLDELSAATGVTPAVNQIEWSPLRFDRTELDGHRARGIVLEGYSALRGGTLQHPVIVEIAQRLGRTPAQVIIRWHLQHGVVVIPKSRARERIVSNADVDGFELSAEDVSTLDALGTPS